MKIMISACHFDDLLKMFSFAKSEEDLEEIKKGLSSYFAKRAEEEMDKLWDEGLWNQEVNEQILHEHLRTSYEE